MARFYPNENIALPVVMKLRQLGHDVLTSLEAGRANAAIPDAEVLAFATSENRILLSHNRKHFLKLHNSRTTDHAGMVLCTVDDDFSALAARLDKSISSIEDTRNQVIRINRPG